MLSGLVPGEEGTDIEMLGKKVKDEFDVYEKKYGIRDYRGGGRSSARETACRVVAGAIAKQIHVF